MDDETRAQLEELRAYLFGPRDLEPDQPPEPTPNVVPLEGHNPSPHADDATSFARRLFNPTYNDVT